MTSDISRHKISAIYISTVKILILCFFVCMIIIRNILYTGYISLTCDPVIHMWFLAPFEVACGSISEHLLLYVHGQETKQNVYSLDNVIHFSGSIFQIV